jgi:Ca2+-binding EF-hand superfamily protein
MCDEAVLRKIFKEVDKDGSGSLDIKEVTDVVRAYYKAVEEPADDKKCSETAATIMKQVDTSGDGSISIDEFIRVFK